MAFEQVLRLCLMFSNNGFCLLVKVGSLKVFCEYWFSGLCPKLKGFMMIWQASFDWEKQQWELTVHPSGWCMLLGKLLHTLLPETCMSSLAFSLRTIVSKYSCASAIFYCDFNFGNICGCCALITDRDLLITSGLAWIHVTNTAASVHFAAHLSDRWRNVDMIQTMPLELFCALNSTVPACCYALCYAELSWPGRGMVRAYRSQLDLCNQGMGEWAKSTRITTHV